MIIKDKILQAVSIQEIYAYYIPDFDSNNIKGKGSAGKNMRSVFGKDGTNPDMSLYYQGESILFKCHVSGHQGDVFQMVADLKGLDSKTEFSKVLGIIAQDLRINDDYRPNYNNSHNGNAPRPVSKQRWKSETVDFTPKALDFWKQYGITKDLLTKYNCKQIKILKYRPEGKKDYNKFTYIFDTEKQKKEILVFQFEVNGRFKMYQPKQYDEAGQEIKKYFCKTQTKGDVFGMSQLEKCQDVIICEGEKDALCAIANGYNAVSFQSANTHVEAEQMRQIKRKAKNVFICYDNDEAGQKASDLLTYKYRLIKVVVPSSFNDIAEYLPKNKQKFDDGLEQKRGEWEADNKINLWEFKSAYYTYSAKQKRDVRISDCTIVSKAMITANNEASRIISIKTRFGETKPFEASVDDFITMQRFKTMLAKKVNESFWGDATDLANIQRLVFELTPIIRQVDGIGYYEEEDKYIFQDTVINECKPVRIPKNAILGDLYIRAADPNKNDKELNKFKFRKDSNINLAQWMEAINVLYGTEKALFFTAFAVSSTVFHHTSKSNGWSPLLNLKGQKGSGKTAAAKFILGLFTNQPTETDIRNTTKNAFMRLFESMPNIPIFLDEFKNNVGTQKIEALKGIFNLTGRTVATYDNSNNVKKGEVLSPCILGGQESANDEALLSRLVTLPFPLVKHTKEQKEMFKRLEIEQEKGLGNVFLEILQYQKTITENYSKKYYDLIEYFSNKSDVQTRLAKNYAAFFAPLEIALESGLNPAFKLLEDDLEQKTTDKAAFIDYMRLKALFNLKEQSKAETSADEINVLIRLFEDLMGEEDERLRITYGIHYEKDVKTNQFFIRTDVIDKARTLYKNRKSIEFTDKSSLLDYLKSSKYHYKNSPDNPRRSFIMNTKTTNRKRSRCYILNLEAVEELINVDIETDI